MQLFAVLNSTTETIYVYSATLADSYVAVMQAMQPLRWIIELSYSGPGLRRGTTLDGELCIDGMNYSSVAWLGQKNKALFDYIGFIPGRK